MSSFNNKNKPAKPYLLPLVSAMVNSTGFKRDDKSVFGMNIYAFMDSVARIAKIKNSELLLQSGYSGFGIDLKKVNDNVLNFFRINKEEPNKEDMLLKAISYYQKYGNRLTSGNGYVDMLLFLSVLVTALFITFLVFWKLW